MGQPGRNVEPSEDDAFVGDGQTLPFDAWLAAELEATALTPQRLARLAGLNRSTISRLLLGQRKPSVDTAARIAVAIQSTRPSAGPERRIDIVGRVRHELLADPDLKPRDVQQVMTRYARLRARIGGASSSGGGQPSGGGGSFAIGEQITGIETGSPPPTT